MLRWGFLSYRQKNKRYTGVARFDALSESDQASVLRQTDALARQQQAEYKTMLDSRVRDATAAYMRGVEFPNPPVRMILLQLMESEKETCDIPSLRIRRSPDSISALSATCRQAALQHMLSNYARILVKQGGVCGTRSSL